MTIPELLSRNFPIFPCTLAKSPAFKDDWKKYGTGELIAKLEDFGENRLIGLCMGTEFDFECIDVDTKNSGFPQEDCIDFVDEVIKMIPDIYVQKTMNNGYHIVYSCEEIQNNQNLAGRGWDSETNEYFPYPVTKDELKLPIKPKWFIETRGNGGYIIVAPSKGYDIVNGSQITNITIEQRNWIIDLAKSKNRILEPVYDNKQYKGIKKYYGTDSIRAGDDYNEKVGIVDELLHHGWKFVRERGNEVHLQRPGDDATGLSASANTEKNLVYIFSTNCHPLESGKSYSPFEVLCFYSFGGNFEECAKELFSKGFGRLPEREKLDPAACRLLIENKGKSKEELLSLANLEGIKIDSHELDLALQNGFESDREFWTISDRGVYKIVTTKFDQFCENNFGFYKIRYNGEEASYVLETNNILKPLIQFDRVAELAIKWLDDSKIPDKEFVKEALRNQCEKIFSKGNLMGKTVQDFKFMEDSADVKYFCIGGNFVKIYKDKIESVPVASTDIKVFEHEYKTEKFELITDSDVIEKCQVARFFQLIGGENYEAFKRAIGYLCHKHFVHDETMLVFFTEDSFDGRSNGGTGKGLIAQLIANFTTVFDVDGKNDNKNDAFRFDGFEKGTKLIHFEDVQKNFSIENLYNMVTKGITINAKNQPKFKELGIKLFASGNYGVNDDGSPSSKRRLLTLPLTGYFRELGPKPIVKEFGNAFIYGWSDEEKNLYYNFMIKCIQEYLAGGLIIPQSENQVRKSLENTSNAGFVEWFDGFYNQGLNGEWSFDRLYNMFLDYTGEKFKNIHRNKFLAVLTQACESYKKTHKVEVYPRVMNDGNLERFVRFVKIGDEDLPFYEDLPF